ncbi:helix-turn-helix domain-containing protein [Marichromatium gracile]|uniref:HTH araC/xylS-type domain-containing protein n=1 Tax=Marichromatium gracile TaxID=1048 RepID=A0ABR5VE27_MARGR|nr:helix-turn-helix domain-containing protein [Marichromatium gracile]KXX63966.1 hypothetical protein AY586_15330 [Marichromatium gracile]
MSAIRPRPASDVPELWRVGAPQLDALTPRDGGWRRSRVRLAGGEACFRLARVAEGIAFTHSRIALRRPLSTLIETPPPSLILAFGLSGVSRFQRPGGTVRIAAGDVWLLPADHAPVERSTPGDEVVEIFLLRFATTGLEDVAALAGQGPRRLARALSTRAWVGELVAAPLDSPLARLRAQGRALDLLGRWLEPLAESASVTLDAGLTRAERRGVARVVERLQQDPFAPPTLAALAAEAGMSHSRLNRCFRRAHGQTVFSWLREQRLLRARRLVRESPELSLTEIALGCGFSSASHFSASFRARFGETPGACRRER